MSALPERVEKLFSVFREAIDDERAAQKVYLQAMELCDDDIMRNAFEALYQDEARHEKELKARYSEMRRQLGLAEGGPS